MYVLGLDNSVSAGVRKRDQKQGDSMIQKEISFSLNEENEEKI